MKRSLLALAIFPLLLAQPANAQDLKSRLIEQEKRIWTAWSQKDEAAYFSLLAKDPVVIIIGQGRLTGRDQIVEEITASPCSLTDFDFSGESFRQLSKDIALLSYLAKQDAQCAGHKLPGKLLVSSIYVREGRNWRMSYYQETPVDE